MFFKKKQISRELYEYCIQEKIADAALIAKWKKPGFENLCCIQCMQTKDHNFNTTCICRVPKSQRDGKPIECVNCGCNGCCG